MNISQLHKLTLKKKKLVIGLMSGTSFDGVDAALVEISESGRKTKIKTRGFKTFPFTAEIKKLLLKNSLPGGGNVTDICRLNALLAHLYADAVKKLCKKFSVSLSEIDLLGSHGQTIHHLPKKRNYLGYTFGSTLQIGDPATVAKLTGIVTVGDFRTGDVAFGGEGAPLVPYFDALLFTSKRKNRLLLNIGGISNITLLPKNGNLSSVIAFDCGPGNVLIDFVMKKYFGKEFDSNGKIAAAGKSNKDILSELIRCDNFIERNFPKSTGREYYNKNFLAQPLKKLRTLSPQDIVATVTEFTVHAIFRNYEKLIKKEIQIDEVIVSGGGAKNKTILSSLKRYFGNEIGVKNSSELGISSDAKEAICFAVLANETLAGNPTNLPQVTGAERATILGKICLP